MQTSKTEIATIAIIILGAAAELAEYLPPKYAGILLAIWAVVRMYLRISGQAELLKGSKDLGSELKSDIEIATSKKAEIATLQNKDV